LVLDLKCSSQRLEQEPRTYNSQQLVRKLKAEKSSFAVGVLISADLSAFTHVWIGYTDLNPALKQGTIHFEGNYDFVRQIPKWLYISKANPVSPRQKRDSLMNS
jgi:hypothetical protein